MRITATFSAGTPPAPDPVRFEDLAIGTPFRYRYRGSSGMNALKVGADAWLFRLLPDEWVPQRGWGIDRVVTHVYARLHFGDR